MIYWADRDRDNITSNWMIMALRTWLIKWWWFWGAERVGTSRCVHVEVKRAIGLPCVWLWEDIVVKSVWTTSQELYTCSVSCVCFCLGNNWLFLLSIKNASLAQKQLINQTIAPVPMKNPYNKVKSDRVENKTKHNQTICIVAGMYITEVDESGDSQFWRELARDGKVEACDQEHRDQLIYWTPLLWLSEYLATWIIDQVGWERNR